MLRITCWIVAAVAAGGPVWAGDTHTWSQSDMAEFQRGVVRHLSVRSDGLLTLAPRTHEALDTASPYLWALARDSKGNLYAGGGPGAKLYRIAPDGKSRVAAELEGMEIHAIAVDTRDRVYAATSPDGKVYRIPSSGKPEVFFDPKAKYIWGMAFDAAGDIFIATGDKGEVHRVKPDGKGSVFFRSDETHARSLAVDGKGGVIVGTEPGGLVIRVSPAGEGFVLYQMGKKEVTAVAVAPDGAIYAAAVGTKGPAPTPGSGAPPSAPPQIPITGQSPPSSAQVRPSTAAPPPPTMGTTAVTGGSEVYRIDPDGIPRRVWNSPQDVVYAIAIDASGGVLLGTGNKGNVYRVESASRHTLLLNLPCTQVTALGGSGGHLYAATANVGKVYEIGPALEGEGSIESDVFDSGLHSAWGRLSFEGRSNGGQIAVATRSGNLDQPQKGWSPWSPAITAAKGARVTSPAARFVQWRATLTGGGSGKSPELESVDVAYLPRNLEPRVDEIEITPPNYKFPAPSTLTPAAPTLSLPPLGRRRAETASTLTLDITSTPTLTWAKGAIGARWIAGDPNGDTLAYKVEIRGVAEAQWIPIKDKVREKYLSWDSTVFPDGEYRLRVTASDAPSNPPDQALSGAMESDPFLIDNTPPRVTGLAAVRTGTRLEVKWHAGDSLSILGKAEYSLDGGDWVVVTPVTKLSDSQELDYALTIGNAAPGEHTIAVRVQDEYDNQAVEKVVVK